MKKVLILCTGNSCRSIMAEGMINKFLAEDLDIELKALSAGVKASGKVNENAKRVLKMKSAWKERYYSKTLDKVIDNEFDLVVTVCDHAKESCPVFPKPSPKIHVGFEDPEGKEFEEFLKLWEDMREKLLPIIRKELYI
jgi:arsenate reductase